MKEFKINHYACWAAIIIMISFLYIWYNFIFYESWLNNNEMKADYFENTSGVLPYIISFITTVLIVYFLAWLFTQLKVDDFQSGMGLALSIGFIFSFLNILGQDMYLFRPIEISLIDGGANLFICMIAGGILGGWRKEGPVNDDL
jgi:uncharacterized protein DUF1761